jgi:hypothetical protein
MEDHTDMLVSYSKFRSTTYIEDFGFQPSNFFGETRRTPMDMYHLCCTVGQSHTLSFSFVRYKFSKRSKHQPLLPWHQLGREKIEIPGNKCLLLFGPFLLRFRLFHSNSSSQGCRRKRATFVKEKAELQTLKPRPNPGPISFVQESRNEVSISFFLDECFATNIFV